MKFINPENIYVTSDTHAFHRNICIGCTDWDKGATRNFDCPEKMTIEMANRINNKVPANGILFHLGDWSFGGYQNIKRFRDMLNVRTIYLICGNHDHHMEKPEVRKLFTQVYGDSYTPFILNVKIAQNRYYLCHTAMKVWYKSHHGVRHLYGHSHGSLPDDPKSLSFDAGVDCHDLTPLSFSEDVERIMSHKKWEPIDHHDSNERE